MDAGNHCLPLDGRLKPRAAANRMGISLRELQRLARRQWGCTPRQWLAQNRWAEALRLLRLGQSVKEVAYELGFKHPSPFIQQFKRRFGCTPGQFAKNQPEYEI